MNGEKQIRSRVFELDMSYEGDKYAPGGAIKESYNLRIITTGFISI